MNDLSTLEIILGAAVTILCTIGLWFRHNIIDMHRRMDGLLNEVKELKAAVREHCGYERGYADASKGADRASKSGKDGGR